MLQTLSTAFIRTLRWARDLGTEGWQAQGVPVPYWRGVWAS